MDGCPQREMGCGAREAKRRQGKTAYDYAAEENDSFLAGLRTEMSICALEEI